MNPKVSIIIPTFNRARLIGETLDSIITQTYKNWECIVVDDRSSDNSIDILKEFSKKDSRIKFFERPNYKTKGANACRNYGYELSEGQYVKWFDSDDIMKPNFIESQVSKLINSSYDFVACLSDTFQERNKIINVNKVNRKIKHHIITSYLVKNHYFLTGSPLWKKEFLESFSYHFNESLKNCDESDFHFRVIIKNPKYLYTPDVLFSIRRGHESLTSGMVDINTRLSRFDFFKGVFDQITLIKFCDQNKLMNYSFKRMLSEFYFLKNDSQAKTSLDFLSTDLKERSRDFKFINRLKFELVIILIHKWGLGYRFIKEKKGLREKIEN